MKITKLKPVGGFCAETGGAITLFLATGLGIPVSTTHTITGAIVGVGATRKLSAVRWGVAGRIVWAWVLTIPCAAFIAARGVVGSPAALLRRARWRQSSPEPVRRSPSRGVVARLRAVGLARTAAALSFTTVLGLVPLLTVAFVSSPASRCSSSGSTRSRASCCAHAAGQRRRVVRGYLGEFAAKAAGLQGVGIAVRRGHRGAAGRRPSSARSTRSGASRGRAR